MGDITFAGSPMNREKLANHRRAMSQKGVQETSLTRVSIEEQEDLYFKRGTQSQSLI